MFIKQVSHFGHSETALMHNQQYTNHTLTAQNICPTLNFSYSTNPLFYECCKISPTYQTFSQLYQLNIMIYMTRDHLSNTTVRSSDLKQGYIHAYNENNLMCFVALYINIRLCCSPLTYELVNAQTNQTDSYCFQCTIITMSVSFGSELKVNKFLTHSLILILE